MVKCSKCGNEMWLGFNLWHCDYCHPKQLSSQIHKRSKSCITLKSIYPDLKQEVKFYYDDTYGSKPSAFQYDASQQHHRDRIYVSKYWVINFVKFVKSSNNDFSDVLLEKIPNSDKFKLCSSIGVHNDDYYILTRAELKIIAKFWEKFIDAP